MKKYSILLTAAALIVLAGCSTSVAVRDFEQNPIPQTSTITNSEADVEKGILKACIQLGWKCTPMSEGKIKGVLDIRTHQLTVDIAYDKTAYSINYKDSINLNYNGKKIHRQYVNWVSNLIRHIDAEMIQQRVNLLYIL